MTQSPEGMNGSEKLCQPEIASEAQAPVASGHVRAHSQLRPGWARPSVSVVMNVLRFDAGGQHTAGSVPKPRLHGWVGGLLCVLI